MKPNVCFGVIAGFTIMVSLCNTINATKFTTCKNYGKLNFTDDSLFNHSCENIQVAASVCHALSECELFSFSNGSTHFFRSENTTTADDCERINTENGNTFIMVSPPFVLVGSKYYYQPKTIFNSVDPAKEECSKHDAKLAEFESQEELEFLLDFISESAYIGARFINTNTGFEWETLRTQVLGSMWSEDEPNQEDRCVQISKATNGLDDIPCTKDKTALCEKGNK